MDTSVTTSATGQHVVGGGAGSLHSSTSPPSSLLSSPSPASTDYSNGNVNTNNSSSNNATISGVNVATSGPAMPHKAPFYYPRLNAAHGQPVAPTLIGTDPSAYYGAATASGGYHQPAMFNQTAGPGLPVQPPPPPPGFFDPSYLFAAVAATNHHHAFYHSSPHPGPAQHPHQPVPPGYQKIITPNATTLTSGGSGGTTNTNHYPHHTHHHSKKFESNRIMMMSGTPLTGPSQVHIASRSSNSSSNSNSNNSNSNVKNNNSNSNSSSKQQRFENSKKNPHYSNVNNLNNITITTNTNNSGSSKKNFYKNNSNHYQQNLKNHHHNSNYHLSACSNNNNTLNSSLNSNHQHFNHHHHNNSNSISNNRMEHYNHHQHHNSNDSTSTPSTESLSSNSNSQSSSNSNSGSGSNNNNNNNNNNNWTKNLNLNSNGLDCDSTIGTLGEAIVWNFDTIRSVKNTKISHSNRSSIHNNISNNNNKRSIASSNEEVGSSNSNNHNNSENVDSNFLAISKPNGIWPGDSPKSDDLNLDSILEDAKDGAGGERLRALTSGTDLLTQALKLQPITSGINSDHFDTLKEDLWKAIDSTVGSKSGSENSVFDVWSPKPDNREDYWSLDFMKFEKSKWDTPLPVEAGANSRKGSISNSNADHSNDAAASVAVTAAATAGSKMANIDDEIMMAYCNGVKNYLQTEFQQRQLHLNFYHAQYDQGHHVLEDFLLARSESDCGFLAPFRDVFRELDSVRESAMDDHLKIYSTLGVLDKFASQAEERMKLKTSTSSSSGGGSSSSSSNKKKKDASKSGGGGDSELDRVNKEMLLSALRSLQPQSPHHELDLKLILFYKTIFDSMPSDLLLHLPLVNRLAAQLKEDNEDDDESSGSDLDSESVSNCDDDHQQRQQQQQQSVELSKSNSNSTFKSNNNNNNNNHHHHNENNNNNNNKDLQSSVGVIHEEHEEHMRDLARLYRKFVTRLQSGPVRKVKNNQAQHHNNQNYNTALMKDNINNSNSSNNRKKDSIIEEEEEEQVQEEVVVDGQEEEIVKKKTTTTTTTTTKHSPPVPVHANVRKIRIRATVPLGHYYPVAESCLRPSGPVLVYAQKITRPPRSIIGGLGQNYANVEGLEYEMAKSGMAGGLVFSDQAPETKLHGSGQRRTGTVIVNAPAGIGHRSGSFRKLMRRLQAMYPNVSIIQLEEVIKQCKYLMLKKSKMQYGFSGFKMSQVVQFIADYIRDNSLTPPEPRRSTTPAQCGLSWSKVASGGTQATKESLSKSLENAPNAPGICALCKMVMVDRVHTQVTSCRHVFHQECLAFWTKSQSVCPTCNHFILKNEEFPSLGS